MLKLSTREKALFSLLTTKEQTIKELAERYFEGEVPFEGANRLAVSLRRLGSKMKYDGKHDLVKGTVKGDLRQSTYKLKRRRGRHE